MKSKTIQIITGVLVLTLAIIGLLCLILSIVNRQVTTYDQCKNAGGTIGESYPEQCFFKGQSFVNNHATDNIGYVGMTEQAALSKAHDENIPARVVERDGKSLPVTMDYVPGRLNFHIKDNTVYDLDVEGE